MATTWYVALKIAPVFKQPGFDVIWGIYDKFEWGKLITGPVKQNKIKAKMSKVLSNFLRETIMGHFQTRTVWVHENGYIRPDHQKELFVLNFLGSKATPVCWTAFPSCKILKYPCTKAKKPHAITKPSKKLENGENLETKLPTLTLVALKCLSHVWGFYIFVIFGYSWEKL